MTNIRPSQFLEWAIKTFGEIARDRHERAMRFAEEAIELAYAAGVAPEDVTRIVRRVYSRPSGTLHREIGQAMATLELLAENLGIDADKEATNEFNRVRQVPKSEWIRRHAAKAKLGIAKL